MDLNKLGLIRITNLPIAVKSLDFIWHVGVGKSMYSFFMNFHIIISRKLLFTNITLKLRRYITTRQLVTFQVTTPFKKFETFGAVVLRAHAALFSQVKT